MKNQNLEVFLYILIRDHLTLGQIEGIMRDHVEPASGKQTIMSAPFVGVIAEDLAKRLRESL